MLLGGDACGSGASDAECGSRTVAKFIFGLANPVNVGLAGDGAGGVVGDVGHKESSSKMNSDYFSVTIKIKFNFGKSFNFYYFNFLIWFT